MSRTVSFTLDGRIVCAFRVAVFGAPAGGLPVDGIREMRS